MSDRYSLSYKLMGKADEAIESAEYSINGAFSLAAANRAYYGCFYCMTALLLSKGVLPKTHKGIRTKFSELFIKSGILPDYITDYTKTAFDLRQKADYDFEADVPLETATDVIGNTKEFYQLSLNYLESLTANTILNSTFSDSHFTVLYVFSKKSYKRLVDTPRFSVL